jgi:hypothetical protein
MAAKKYLKLVKGNAELYNASAQKIKSYYMKGDAIRVDWEDESKESVQVQLKNGKLLIINSSCQIIRTI